jgi:hypothetical protein
MALLTSDLVTACRVLEIYQTNKGGRMPANWKQLGLDIGLFQTEFNRPEDAEKKELRDQIICSLYMVPGAGPKGKLALDSFIQNHKEGFVPGTRDLKREQTSWEGNYAMVATQLGRFKEVAFARAVHLVARRRIGMALAPSPKGGELDILIGHKQESY